MRIGVFGGGQLGRMLALAGYALGHEFTFLEPSPEATRGLGTTLEAPFDDARALAALVAASDVVTYEFENVPAAAARWVAERVPVWPSPAALDVAQDRLSEKQFFGACGLPTVPFRAARGRAELATALDRVGLPAIVKTRRHGYDGKGQALVTCPEDLEAACAVVGEAPCIVERRIDFRRELSVIAVRGRDGSYACWPLVENQHDAGILRQSLAPAPDVPPALQALAESHVRTVLERLGYVGVLAIELFEVDGELLANEMAPRVHNSAHWTIEGAETSQFENHLRAIAGMPLGSTAASGVSAMVNLIGTLPSADAVLAIPGVHLHRYGKAARPGRKLGHLTVRANERAVLQERLRAVYAVLQAGAQTDA